MSSIPRIDPPEPDTPVNFVTLLGHTPRTRDLFFTLYGQLWQHGLIDPALREMTRLRNARTTDCGY